MKIRNKLLRHTSTAAAATLAVALFAPQALAADEQIIIETDFEDGTYQEWQRSGNPNLEVVEVDGTNALLVGERANDYDGIKSNAGLFSGLEPGDEIQLEMRVRLADGVSGATAAFVSDPGYTHIGTVAMSDSQWSQVSGEYVIPSDVDPAELQFYIGTSELDPAASYDYYVDDIVITASAGDGGTEPGEPGEPIESLDSDFETDLNGWEPRSDANGSPTVERSDIEAHGGSYSALITDRTSDGHGLGRDVTGIIIPGRSYELSAWVKFGSGAETDDVWLSMAATTSSTSYSTLAQFTGMSNSEWVEVTATFNAPTGDELYLYFETAYNGGNTSDFYVDDIVVREATPGSVQDLEPLANTVSFPMGAAVDSRELTGSAAELLTRHFNQVTSENYMKPEAWYDGDGNFRMHTEAAQLMDFAQANDLGVYGHTLVWHSQTPDWFFNDDDGNPLTSSAGDQQTLRERMRTHIFAVAEALSDEYGLFGSDTNPLVAFDVVNEVVADTGADDDGLRRSRWFQVLGEDYLDLAFEYAEEAFNDQYAQSGSNRPVALFINDYNTEQSGKQQRMHALVERMLGRDAPIDGVGHQFHLNLSTSVTALDAALNRFSDLDVVQAVTELDVTTGTPVTDANLIEQGYYYRDAFNIFREHADDIYSVTVWGLTDGRSWRNDSGAPLLFDDSLQAKPAYFGAANGDLPPHVRTANVFQPSEDLQADDPQADEWQRLPLFDIEDAGAFQLRWTEAGLIAYVEVVDGSDFDRVEFTWTDQTGDIGADGSGTLDGAVAQTDSGYVIVAQLPLTGLSAGDAIEFDARIIGSETAGWNTAGALGTLTLVEPLSFMAIPEADQAPSIDGQIDDVWAAATTVYTDKEIDGTNGARAQVRTLWRDETLFVLMEVTDPDVDLTGSDPWIQDSVEIYIDPGNAKNGPYRYEDSQIRISAENDLSFGTGDEAFQRGRVESATSLTDDGYLVEAAITLGEAAGPGTFHGMDFQLNDATNGARTAIRNWADPSNAGYQSTARWGVGEFVPAETDPGDGTDEDGTGDDGSDEGGAGDDGTGQDGDGATEDGSDEAGAGTGGTGDNGSTNGAGEDETDGRRPAGSLPRTGSEIAPLIVLAVALLLAGGASLGVRRLRARS